MALVTFHSALNKQNPFTLFGPGMPISEGDRQNEIFPISIFFNLAIISFLAYVGTWNHYVFNVINCFRESG